MNTLLTIVAYVLVVFLVQFCLMASWLISFPLALLFSWTSVSFRTKVVGFCDGIVGIAFAVTLGYVVFRLLVGPESFTTGVFLASTVPLLLPIRNNFKEFMRHKALRGQFLETIANSRGEKAVSALAEDTKTAHGSVVIGDIVGLALAIVWFFSR